MTFITMMQTVAKNAGVEVPTSIAATDPDHILLGQFINEAGQELARRIDWGVLRKTATLTGTGALLAHTLPDDFDRFSIGLSVVAGVQPVRGSITSDEWMSLPPVEGTPRYYYLAGRSISFYPFLRTGGTARVQYQSKNWAATGATPSARLTQQTDTTVLPEPVLETGAIWRWRRHIGKDFADHLAEFEAQLVDFARADSGVRLP